MEENVISAKDRFLSMQNQKSYYMAIPQTQQPEANSGDGEGNGVHCVKCKRLLALNVPISNWTTNEATFGAAKPSEYARDNVSLFLKVIQWAVTARINFYIETLYDDVLAKVGILSEVGKRLFVPVSEHKEHELAAVMMSSLAPEEAAPPTKKRKTSKPAQPAQTEDEIVFDSYVSHKRISSEARLLDVLNRMWMCSVEAEVNEINFEMIGTDIGGADDAGDDALDADRNSIFWLFDYKRVFESEQSKEWMTECRIPDWQQSPDFYYDTNENLFTLHLANVFESFETTMRIIKSSSGFLNGNADALRNYCQQTVTVPMECVRTKLCELSQVNGFHRRDKYTRMTDEETLKLFVSVDGQPPILRDFSHRARIEAPDPFAPSQGMTFSKEHEYLVTPIVAKYADVLAARRNEIIDCINAGDLDISELDRVNGDLAETVTSILETSTPGVPTMYGKVYAERQTLIQKMSVSKGKHTTNVARMARKIFFFKTSALQNETIKHMEFEDMLYCSYADILASHLNATPFQARTILKCKTYCAVLMRNYFGPQNGVCMQGTCDVGKSHAAKTLTQIFPSCQIQQENDASEKAYVMMDMSMYVPTLPAPFPPIRHKLTLLFSRPSPFFFVSRAPPQVHCLARRDELWRGRKKRKGPRRQTRPLRLQHRRALLQPVQSRQQKGRLAHVQDYRHRHAPVHRRHHQQPAQRRPPVAIRRHPDLPGTQLPERAQENRKGLHEPGIRSDAGRKHGVPVRAHGLRQVLCRAQPRRLRL
jgi:hypothetical protein